MAIQVGGTTVIDNSRNLQNVGGLKTVGGTSILGSGNISAGASTTYGAVGTYIFGDMSTSGITENSTYSGSSIQPAGVGLIPHTNSFDAPNDSGAYGSYWTKGGGTLSGTWRAMGRHRANSGSRNRITLFVRVS